MTTRQVLIVGGIVGLLVSSAVLALIWFGVAGVLGIGNTNLIQAITLIDPDWATAPSVSVIAMFQQLVSADHSGCSGSEPAAGESFSLPNSSSTSCQAFGFFLVANGAPRSE